MKKNFSYICILIIFVMSFIPAYAQEDASTDYDTYIEAINQVNAFNLYKVSRNTKADWNSLITQEEFLSQVSQVMNMNFDKSYFKSMGILPFKENLRYDESGQVTLYDALKTLMIFTGYNVYAINKGYEMCANQYGFIDNVNYAYNTPLTKAVCARLIMNAVEIDVLQPSSIGEGTTVTYESVDNNNLLKLNFDIYKTEGIVTSTSFRTAARNVNAVSGRTSINKISYSDGNLQTNDYFGFDVRAYYKKRLDESIGTLLYIEKKDLNNSLTLNDEDINSYSEREYQYEVNGKIKRVKVPASADIVYNDSYLTFEEAKIKNMKPKCGAVTFIDNNGDGKYNLVIIDDYDLYVTDSVNISKKIVFAKYSKGYIDLNGENREVYINDSDGSEIDITSVFQWNVVNVKKSGNGSLRAVITSDTVSGNVKEIKDSGEKVILEDGTEIKIRDYLKSSFNSVVTAGDAVTFYMDITGTAAAFQSNGSSLIKTAYLIALKKTQGIDSAVKLKMYDIDQQCEVSYNCAPKVIIDENMVTADTNVLNIIQPDGKELEPQLIRFKLNSKQEVEKIDLAYDNKNSLRKAPDNGLIKIFSSPLKNVDIGSRQGFYFQAGTAKTYTFHKPIQNNNLQLISWNESFCINSETKMIYIPYDRNNISEYRTVSMASLTEGDKVIDAYRIGDNTVFPSIVLLYAGDGTQSKSGTITNNTDKISNTAPSYIVSGISKVLKDDGEVSYKLTLCGKDGEITMLTSTSELLDSLVELKIGYVIRYCVNPNNEIDGISVLVNENNIKSPTGVYNSTNSLNEFRYMAGAVYEKYDSLFAITLKDVSSQEITNNDLFVFNPVSAKIYVYDAKENSVKEGSSADIYDYVSNNALSSYSKLFVQTKNGGVIVFFVFNNLDV